MYTGGEKGKHTSLRNQGLLCREKIAGDKTSQGWRWKGSFCLLLLDVGQMCLAIDPRYRLLQKVAVAARISTTAVVRMYVCYI